MGTKTVFSCHIRKHRMTTETNTPTPRSHEVLPAFPCQVRQLSQQEKEELKVRIGKDIGHACQK